MSFTPDEADAIRQMLVRPSAPVVCPRCGAALTTGEPIAGGGSIMMVWELSCERCRRTMVVSNLPDRAAPERARAPTTASEQDRTAARRIPDEYMRLRSRPDQRVMELINRCWKSYPDGERRQLAQVLLAILTPLNRDAPTVTEELRQPCEAAVVEWIEKQGQTVA